MSMGRFLRIGLVREGQVLEERLVPMGSDITIGKAPGNTFVVPQGDLPKSSLAFKARGHDRHALVFGRPNGRVDLGGGEPATLSELVQKGLAVKKDKVHQLPLPKGARGKFDIGDVTVLFHYVERDLAISAKGGPRPLVLEATLTWEGTALAVKKWDVLGPVTLGPGTNCDLQLPGRVLESRAHPIIDGADGRFFVNLKNPFLKVISAESEFKGEDGTRSMQPVDPGERFAIKGPFEMRLELRDGFALELKFLPAVSRPVESPFDIQDPQPILCLAGSALVHAAIMALAFAFGHALLEPGEVKAAKAERRREIQTMLQEQKVEQKAEEEKQAAEKKDEKKPEEDKSEAEEAKKPEPRPEPRRAPEPKAAADAGAANPEARRTKLKEDVRKKTFLGAAGGFGDGDDGALPIGRETQYADAFQDVDAPYAANGATNDGLAPPGPKTGEDGGGEYKTLSKEERGGGNIDTKTVKTSDKGADQEARVQVNVRTGSLGAEGGLGKIDNNAVASVFSRRKGAIKSCYEKELRRNPGLKGRITLRFTIGTSGRITAINASQNTTGDQAIESCIIEKVRNWKFDPPSGGAVTFTYPFILEAR